jgi:hypothetical protein
MNKCSECRFFKCNSCSKFNVTVDESYVACPDFADTKPMNESQEKMKLYD